jgi:hypothetical protein
MSQKPERDGPWNDPVFNLILWAGLVLPALGFLKVIVIVGLAIRDTI